MNSSVKATAEKETEDRLRTSEDREKDVFSDEEVLELEQELIETYLMSADRPIRILLRMYKKYIREILLSMFFYCIKTLPCIVLPIITAKIINLAANPSEDFAKRMLIYIVIMVFVLILNIPTHMLHIKYYSIVSRKVEAGLRGAMVRKLQQLSITFHKEMQSGRIQSKLMRDVETIQGLSTHLFSTLPGIVINVITALIVVLGNDFRVFLFFLICIPCSILTVRYFHRPINRTNRDFRRDTEHTSANIMDMVEMTQITRAHALEQKEVRKMTSILNTLANTGFRLDMVTALFGSISWVMFQIFQFACLIFSAFMAYKGNIEIGDISLYQAYFTTLTGQVSTIIGLVPVISKGIESISSVGEILCSDDIEDNEGKEKLSGLRGEYEFRDVRFSYEADQPLLKGINLKVKAGETVAFVGESGSGKTTLMNLLIGFNMPTAGTLLVDGHDITGIDLHSYREHISTVPQNSVLFTGTIRENVTYGLSDVTEARLRTALEAARLTELVDSLPNGVDTQLEEHGANLSGGQRQRLSIARALIRDPDVILLDEATSALDSVSERQIQDAINNLTRGRTTFIVAHRLSTIKNADIIAVIKDGVCVESGSFDELMELKGEFYHLRTLQQI
ncbi:MAG: ABC transporter ATP-binding protein [Clostridiales bacterium]|nr:ABC transporter ATP-binding protein [Clostridiales bacterium]